MALVLCAGAGGDCETGDEAIDYLADNEITVGRYGDGCADGASQQCRDHDYARDEHTSYRHVDLFLSRLPTNPGYTPPVPVYYPPSTGSPSCDNGYTVIAEHIDSVNSDDGCRPPHCDFGRDADGWCEPPASDTPPVVYVATDSNLFSEGGGSASFTVALSHRFTADVTVDASTTDGTATAGSDYTAVSSQAVTIPAGDRYATVSAAVLDDSDDEPDETFNLLLSNPTGSATLSASPQAEATIVDNDPPPPPVPVTDLWIRCIDRGGGRWRLQTSWAAGVATEDRPVGESYSYEWIWHNGRVWGSPRTIAHDRLHLLPASLGTNFGINRGATYQIRVTPQHSVRGDGPSRTASTICPTPDPQVTVNFDQASYTVTESDDAATPAIQENQATVTVTLSENPHRTVTIPIVATNQGGADSGDYTGVPVSVTFNGGETFKSFTVTATDDTDNDDGEAVHLSFGTLPDRVNAGATDEATVSITDDDVPPPTVSVADATVAESAGAAVFTITLSRVHTEDVTVDVATSDSATSDSAISDLAAFNAAYVAARDDLLAELARSGLDGYYPADDFYRGFYRTYAAAARAAHSLDARIPLGEDDPPALPPSSQQTLQDAIDVLAVAAGIPQRLIDAPTSAPADYTAISTTVTITAGNTTATVSVPVTDDTDTEPDETFTITLSNPTNATLGTATATGTITDDDGTSPGFLS